MTDLAVQSIKPTSFIDEWERQVGETAKAWSAFVIFRDMGLERSVLGVRDKAGAPFGPNALLRWAEKYRWVERAMAYDRMIDRRRIQAHVDEVEAMARRQVQIGQTLQHRGLEYVQEELDTVDKRAKNLTANTALRFIDTGVNLEREGLGMDDRNEDPLVNVTVNVLDAGTKADVFAKIDQMASNIEAIRAMETAPPDIIDAELVEDDATEDQ